MSKPIFMTPEIIEEVTANFRRAASELMLFQGKRTIDIDYYWAQSKNPAEQEHVTITFTRQAWKKQQALVQGFSSEVGWHGVVSRDEADPLHFTIEDILVFPQQVTGATVTPDEEAYAIWNATLPPDQRNAMRFHGHSHVNMGVTPSSTDDRYQKDMLGRLNGDGLTEQARAELKASMGKMAFYIFMILNKSGSTCVRVFDYWGNAYYEGNEITIEHEPDEFTDFFADAKAKVVTKSYSSNTGYYSSGRYGGGVYGGNYYGSSTTPKKQEDKSAKKENSLSVRGSAKDDDHAAFPGGLADDYGNYDYTTRWWQDQYAALLGGQE